MNEKTKVIHKQEMRMMLKDVWKETDSIIKAVKDVRYHLVQIAIRCGIMKVGEPISDLPKRCEVCE